MASNSSRDEDVRLLSQLVGRQLRQARIRRNLTESALARKIGVTTDQIIGYEEGSEPPDLARLAELATGLEVPIAQLISAILGSETEAEAAFEDDEERRDAVRLVRLFSLIEDQRIRKSFVEWIEAIATSTGKPVAGTPANEAETKAPTTEPEPGAAKKKPGSPASARKSDPGGPAGKKGPVRRRRR